ncbi:hypothetical protein [Dictyoglomus sp.]|uniref:hypothetical protein n=1 Tax=Dictyoglomus sp. TaxID=28205 RepID=UPI003D0B4172
MPKSMVFSFAFMTYGFAPNFFFDNLPTTSKAHAERSFKLAREKGLKYVNIGNRFLLSHYY